VAVLQQGALHTKAWRMRSLACAHASRSVQVVYDFDEFMNIPPCTTGRHNADADGGGYAKLAK
jgi:hypothetical protein